MSKNLNSRTNYQCSITIGKGETFPSPNYKKSICCGIIKPEYKVALPLETIATLITDPINNSFSPALFTTKAIYGVTQTANHKRWVGQEMVVLEFDNSLAFTDARDRWNKYQLYPAFAYTFYGDKNHTRYRLCFNLEYLITKFWLFNAYTLKFSCIFPEADWKGFYPNRIYHSGRKATLPKYRKQFHTGRNKTPR